VEVEDGYVYCFDQNKLIHANKDPIDISLSLTCRQITSEVAEIALSVNEVVFKTYGSKETMCR
jgi:hypothetical protein